MITLSQTVQVPFRLIKGISHVIPPFGGAIRPPLLKLSLAIGLSSAAACAPRLPRELAPPHPPRAPRLPPRRAPTTRGAPSRAP